MRRTAALLSHPTMGRRVLGLAAGALAACFCLAVTPAAAQFAPGKLSRGHASIAGTTECFRCHEPRKATTAERCLACHTALGSRIAAGTGFHGRMSAEERGSCGVCHTEHGGENASLVHWPDGPRSSFDHQRTGFGLTGKHASLQCDQCHKAALVRAADVRAGKALDIGRTHLGLSTRCAECHQDSHRGQFASRIEKDDCAACHGSTETWKKTSFDHASARFRLAGKHAALACDKCHFPVDAAGTRVAAGTSNAAVRYRPIDFTSCAGCHTDPHREQFGRDCARCHTPEGWKNIALAGFDHSRARFALTGKHLQVDCARCHYSENAAGQRVAASSAGARVHYKPLVFAACTDCHQDPHQKRFGLDCARCHSTAGWTTIAAGAFDHDKTRYPLRGRHAQVTCEKCHRDRKNSPLPAFAACTDCHADAHGAQLASRSDGGACEACHTVDGFAPARFGAEEHLRTKFGLEGAHRAIACLSCHRPAAGGRSGAAGTLALAANALPPGTTRAPQSRPALATASDDFRFRFTSLACAGCHDDPHAGQFAATVPAATKPATETAGTDCARCHAATTWRIAGFDHDKTRFPLQGAHKRTACSSCHRPAPNGGPSVVRYKPLETACRACHAEPKPLLGK